VKRYSKSEIIPEITNGNRDVLVYLARKYFPSARRLLRIRGFHDEQTPDIFSDVLVTVFMKLQRQPDEYLDFEIYLLRALNEHIKSLKENSSHSKASEEFRSVDIVSQCVTIMDEQSQQLLFSRVSGKMSYERIKDKFQFSNAVIAQYEVNKAFGQLEGIVKLRLNFS
jgi:hypothetical protein